MKILGVFLLIMAGVIAYLLWIPVPRFFISLIPATAEYAWVGKIFVYVMIMYAGGIVFPLLFVILACACFIGYFDD